MKATELLTMQHEEVSSLFERIERATRRNEQAELFTELASNLLAHDLIEREIFYPACQQNGALREMINKSVVEHTMIELALQQGELARRREDGLAARVVVLKEMMEHHVDEEEHGLFPRVERALGAQRLEQLGLDMERRFEELREQGYERLLAECVRRALVGASGAASTSSKRTSRRPARAAKKPVKRATPERGARGKAPRAARAAKGQGTRRRAASRARSR